MGVNSACIVNHYSAAVYFLGYITPWSIPLSDTYSNFLLIYLDTDEKGYKCFGNILD